MGVGATRKQNQIGTKKQNRTDRTETYIYLVVRRFDSVDSFMHVLFYGLVEY